MFSIPLFRDAVRTLLPIVWHLSTKCSLWNPTRKKLSYEVIPHFMWESLMLNTANPGRESSSPNVGIMCLKLDAFLSIQVGLSTTSRSWLLNSTLFLNCFILSCCSFCEIKTLCTKRKKNNLQGSFVKSLFRILQKTLGFHFQCRDFMQ